MQQRKRSAQAAGTASSKPASQSKTQTTKKQQQVKTTTVESVRFKPNIPAPIVRDELKDYDQAQQLIKMFLDPETYSAELGPNYSANGPMNQILSKQWLTLNLDKDHSNCPFTIVGYPSAAAGLFCTDFTAIAPSQYAGKREFDVLGFPAGSTNPPGAFEFDRSLHNPINGTLEIPMQSPGGAARILPYHDASLNVWKYPLDVTYAAMTETQTMTFTLYMPEAFQIGGGTLHVVANGVDYPAGLDPVTGIATAEILGSSVTTPVHVESFYFIHQSNQIVANSITYQFTIGGVGSYVPSQVKGSLSLVFNQSSSIIDDLQKVANSISILGMSLLTTYYGSDEFNGGVIAGHRLPARTDNSSSPENRYDNLGKITGAYPGALKTGAYTFWLPEKPEDLELVPTHYQGRGDPFIVNAGAVDNPGQTVRLCFVQLIRFTTISRMYSPVTYGSNAKAWELAMAMLSETQQYCGPNETHLRKIQRMLKYVYDHRSQIANGVATAGQIAAKVAPLIASVL